MADNVERYNQVQIELFSKSFGSVIIQEPKGWEGDTRSYKRDKKSRGIVFKTEIGLEFFGEAKDLLTQTFKSRGIQEKVLISKFEKSVLSISEDWKLRYIQELDMGTLKENVKINSCTVQATEGGIYDDIKKRRSAKYNLINTESADGIDIGELRTYRFLPQPRSIFFESFLKDSQTGYRVNSAEFKAASLSQTSRTIPLRTVYISNADNTQIPYNTDDSYNDVVPQDQGGTIGSEQNIGDMFYYRSDIDRRVKLTLKLKFKIEDIDFHVTTSENLLVELRKSEAVGDVDELKSRVNLFVDNDPKSSIGIIREVSIPLDEQSVDLLQGESLSLVFFTDVTLGNGFERGRFNLFINVMESELVIEDDTLYQVTQSRCLKPFDLFERLVAKITGHTGRFKSTLFGVGGEYENMVIDNGFWARGFPDTITDSDGETRDIQLLSSFKDAFEGFNYLEPLTWFSEISGKVEVIRIEKATYTMQNFIGLSLTAVDNIKHLASKPDFFSNIKIGHKKSMEYEEINGLDEPNGLSEMTTHISRNEAVYAVVSDIRFDPTRYELTRRKQYVNFPKEDTKADKDLFMHDANWNGSYFTHNLWDTINPITGDSYFDSEPTGIFDPSTAWNLRLSPMNRLFYGHGYSIKRGLYHFPYEKVRFNSSNSNQNLKTVIAGFLIDEGGTLTVSDLPNSLIEPEKTTMTFKITQAIEDQLLGHTKIGNDLVPNYFGLIEYLENGEKRYGRINKLSTDDESKLEIQNARIGDGSVITPINFVFVDGTNFVFEDGNNFILN